MQSLELMPRKVNNNNNITLYVLFILSIVYCTLVDFSIARVCYFQIVFFFFFPDKNFVIVLVI